MFGHAIVSLVDIAIHVLPPYVTLGVATIALICFGLYAEGFWMAVTLWSLATTTGFFSALAWKHR